MLALTRRVGEEVVIGDPRKPLGVIRVVEIHGEKVRLSFDFPREMEINRRELADEKAKLGPLPPSSSSTDKSSAATTNAAAHGSANPSHPPGNGQAHTHKPANG